MSLVIKNAGHLINVFLNVNDLIDVILSFIIFSDNTNEGDVRK